MSFTQHCKEAHSLPDVCCPEIGLEFSLSEAQALWRFLSHEYISYEDTELLDAVRKLSRFVQANE
jgi:hypothetical protein